MACQVMQAPRSAPHCLVIPRALECSSCASGPSDPDSRAGGADLLLPWPPEWVAQGKYQKMILQGIIASNPGEWDVQACGTLPGCLMPLRPAVQRARLP